MKKKILLLFVTVLTLVGLVGCKKTFNTFDRFGLFKKSYIADLANKSENPAFKQYKTEGLLTSDDEYVLKKGELLFLKKDDIYKFYNIFTKKTYEVSAENTEIAWNFSGIHGFLYNHNFFVLKVKDGANEIWKFIAISDFQELLTLDIVKGEDKYTVSVFEKRKIEDYTTNEDSRKYETTVVYTNDKTHEEKKYFFSEYRLIDKKEAAADYSVFTGKGVYFKDVADIGYVFKDGKLYDSFLLPQGVNLESYELNNGNILLQYTYYNMEFDEKDVTLDYYNNDDGKKVVYYNYLYNFKSKTLEKIYFPYLVNDVYNNREDNTGKKPYGKKVQNIMQAYPIDEKTKSISNDTDNFVVDNELKKVELAKGYGFKQISKDLFLEYLSSSLVKLYNAKGKLLRTVDGIYKVLEDRYLVMPTDSSKEVSVNYTQVYIYDIVTDKVIAKDYFVPKLAISSRTNYYRDVDGNSFCFSGGKLTKVEGENFAFSDCYGKGIFFTKTGETVYCYDKFGNLLFKDNVTNASVLNSTMFGLLSRYNKVQTLIKYQTSDSKFHYVMLEQNFE